MRSYELVFIVPTEVEGDELTALVEDLEGVVERSGGEVTQAEPWGMRRLAYPIKGHQEGRYVVFQLDLEPQGVAEVERALHLRESILRHLIVRVD